MKKYTLVLGIILAIACTGCKKPALTVDAGVTLPSEPGPETDTSAQ